MANFKELKPFILKWEGGFINDPDDKGGATNKGVTLKTFRYHFGNERTVEDLKNITENQWDYIFKEGFWDKMKGDDIKSQSVANALVDWAYNSGPYRPSVTVQRIVGEKEDGVIGPKTVKGINSFPSAIGLFNMIQEARLSYCNKITDSDPSQSKFICGWRNRINSIKYND